MSTILKIVKFSTVISLAIIIVERILSWGEPFIWKEQAEHIIIVFGISAILTIISVYYEAFISKKYSWEQEPKKRLLFGSLGSITVILVTYGLLRMLLFVGYFNRPFADFISNEDSTTYLIFIIVAVFISLFIHAFYFYKALQDTKVKEQKIIAGSASAKFDALKNQLDPHFLFNSLNVLTSLIEEDPGQAQKFTTSLSKVYRYVLEQKSKNLISVDEELQFAKTYVRLLKMRFEDSIIFEIPDKALNPEAKIVPLSLQLLLENAVKHNVVTSYKPLHIKIFEEGDFLYVTNNLQEKQVVKKSSGVGLQNIRQRYAILTKEEMQIFKNDKEFKVRLPMLINEVAFKETQETFISSKRYEKAKERVELIKGFYGNLISYCIVIPFLAYINYRTTSFIWVIFPMIGWGIGLIGHGLRAYGYNPLFGKNWEQRKIKQYMEDENF
tara:strand:+ start:615 stop:1937 length:1323 start_codon:yes stop_codon:yes gene_type:complete